MMMNRMLWLKLCLIILCNEIYSTKLPDVIETTSGFICGNVLQTPLSDTQFHAYRGIPYAEAPIGKLRFKAPQSFQARKGEIIEAFKYGPACFQSSGGSNTLEQSEDCLSINVFVPEHAHGKKLPVIAFIYGGAFSKGHSTDIQYGPDFLVGKGVIFVSFNYRGGALGFMSLGIKGFSGNMGLKDQQLALKWIHDNIEQFGGNKYEVTLLGHSAGSASAHYHLLNKESRNYFKRIVLMSGVVTNYFTRSILNNHKQIMYEFAKSHTGKAVPSDNELLTILQAMDVRNITAYKRFNESMSVLETIWAPVYDGLYAIPEYDNETFVNNFPEKLYEEYQAEGVEKAAIFSFTSMEAFIVNIFNDPTKIQHLNVNFYVTLPFHGFTKDKYEKKYEEIMQKIKYFYFGDEPIDKDSTFKYFNLMSDVNFAYGINKAVKLHANKSNSPTYFLRFSVSGLFNNLKKKLNAYQYDTPGCGHGEERNYIFKTALLQEKYKGLYENRNRFKDNAIAFDTLEYMTELLSTFAKTGIPKIESAYLHEFPVVKGDVAAFVDITNDGIVTGLNPNERVFQFWREIEQEVNEEMRR